MYASYDRIPVRTRTVLLQRSAEDRGSVRPAMAGEKLQRRDGREEPAESPSLEKVGDRRIRTSCPRNQKKGDPPGELANPARPIDHFSPHLPTLQRDYSRDDEQCAGGEGSGRTAHCGHSRTRGAEPRGWHRYRVEAQPENVVRCAGDGRRLG